MKQLSKILLCHSPLPMVLVILVWLVAGCGGSDDPALPPPPDWDEETEVVVGSEGGTVSAEDGDFTLLIPQGAFDEETAITVGSLPVEDHPLLDPRLTGTGKVYRFSGLKEFDEPLVIELAVSPEQRAEEDTLIIYFEEEVFLDDPSVLGQAGRPLLSTVFDPEAGVLRGMIPPHVFDETPEEGAKARTDIDIIVARGEHRLRTYFTDEFKFSWVNSQADMDWIKGLYADLFAAKAKLEALGYEFCASGRISVDIVPIADADGNFIDSKFGVGASYIQLDPSLEGRERFASAGHELFHMFQACYGNCGHYWGYSHNWAPEACSIWFEPVLLEDPTYVAEIQNTNRNFLRDGLEKNTDKTGYGAATFYTWLTDRYDRNLVREINEQIATDPRADGGGVKALAAALAARGLDLEDEFRLFVRDFTGGLTSHSGWLMPDPVEQPILRESRRSYRLSPQMMDYSAMSYRVANGWNDELAPALSLVVESTSPAGLDAIVFKGATPTGPWSQVGVVTPSHPITINSFGQLESTRKVQVVLVNVQNEAPFTGMTRAGVTVRFASCTETEIDSFDGYLRAIIHVTQGGYPVDEAQVSYRYYKIHCDGHLGHVGPYTGETAANGFYYAAMEGVFSVSNSQERFVAEATVNGVTRKYFLPYSSLIGSNLFAPVEANIHFDF